MKNKNNIIIIILLLALTASAVFSSGCISENIQIPEISSVEIPEDVHEGIHDIYNDLNYLELTISQDVHALSEQITEAENSEEIQTVLIDYYAENPWITSIIYRDAVSDEVTTVPVHLSESVLKTVPFPTDEQIQEAKNGEISKSGTFVKGYGYLNTKCKALYDDDGNYIGYFMILFDLYTQLNLHPIVLLGDKHYGDYACFIVDSTGQIIFSSREESIGEYVTERSPFYNGLSLVKNGKGESGAYRYTSDAFYNYLRGTDTDKITAWHKFNKGTYSYKVYLIKEVDRPEFKTENVYNPNPQQLISEVNSLYVYARLNGVDKTLDYLKNNDFDTTIHIFDMDGNIISSTIDGSIGMNYMNRRGVYGNSYIMSAISAVEQGGGYIYYTLPVDGTIDSPAFEYAIAYILPIDNEHFIFGRTSGSPNAILKDNKIMSDLTLVSREILKEVNDKGINYAIDMVNSNPESSYWKDTVGINTDVEYVSVNDYTGKMYASTKFKDTVGKTVTYMVDVYGGSTVRRAIILAENGSGFTTNLIANSENPGFVDLWLLSVEPVNDEYFIVTGAYLATFEDYLTPYLNN